MRRRGLFVLGVLFPIGAFACGGGSGQRLDGAVDAVGDSMNAGDSAGRLDLSMEAAVDLGTMAVDGLSPMEASSEAGAPDLTVRPLDKVYACGELLAHSGNLLNLWRDPWTGLPYDSIPCGGPYADTATSSNPAWGVVPQLPSAAISAFSEDASRTTAAVTWSFKDRDPDKGFPSLLWALQIALHLDDGSEGGAGNHYGGLIWNANADIRRYAQVRIRYRTSNAMVSWQFKLNSGTTTPVEPAVTLPATTVWTDRTFTLADAFPATDLAHLNYLTFASSIAAGGAESSLWVDQVSFVPDPAHLADCDVSCPPTLPAYPDMACYEPQTRAVNIGNALTFLSTAPAASLLDEDTAKVGVQAILASLESLPTAGAAVRANGTPYAGGGWFQDWHSPVSLMPNPNNRMASLTDQPQLYAALMVVETTWPDLATRAAALRAKMDFSVLYDDRMGCPGKLLPGIDRCTGLNTAWTVDRFGTDYLLGAFLAEATAAAPRCFWTDGLSRNGCALAGPSQEPWYSAGDLCAKVAIPASDSGGPFLQLAGLLYLASDKIPLGALSLGDSAKNMLRAQYKFAEDNHLDLAGWASASDPDGCAYTTCTGFVPDKVTPYVSAMAASDDFPETYRMLRAFHLSGSSFLFYTGSFSISLGLRDGWNQSTSSGRTNYLYLDTGWSELGLLNACHADLVRQRFGQHPVAQAGYALLQAGAPPCP